MTIINVYSIRMKFFTAHRSQSFSKGFTLIELLVVIGILGVLAAALVATIDPFEQLRKANDANVKNTAVEFINANIRYYTTHSNMPWDNTACAGGTGVIVTSNLSSVASGCLGLLIADGEIKPGFTTVTGVLSKIIVSGSSNGVTACFQPESRAQQRDLNTKYTISGVETTGCVSQSGGVATTCYWCSQ